jgi:hypothetical protein
VATKRKSKSARIRQAFHELGPDTRPAVIREHLAARRVRTSLTLISKIKRTVNAAANGNAKSTAPVSVPVAALLGTKDLVARHGSDAVRQSLKLLQQLVT